MIIFKKIVQKKSSYLSPPNNSSFLHLQKSSSDHEYSSFESPQKRAKFNASTIYPNVIGQKLSSVIDVFSDGSCQNGILKYGAFFSYNGIEYFLSGSFDELKLKSLDVPYSNTINSPTSELLGVLCSLQSFFVAFVSSEKLILKKSSFTLIIMVSYRG
jgi:hypothetical protein